MDAVDNKMMLWSQMNASTADATDSCWQPNDNDDRDDDNRGGGNDDDDDWHHGDHYQR